MKFDRCVLRIFDVRAKPGKADLLLHKLSGTSISVVRGKRGNIGHLFGKNVSSDGNDLVFISMWKDLDSVKARFGDEWEQSFLPEGYEELIENCSVRHVEFDGELS